MQKIFLVELVSMKTVEEFVNWDAAYADRDARQTKALESGLTLNECRYALRAQDE